MENCILSENQSPLYVEDRVGQTKLGRRDLHNVREYCLLEKTNEEGPIPSHRSAPAK